MTEAHVITGIAPETRLIGLNDRSHWSARARRAAEWRRAGFLAACAWRTMPSRALPGRWLVRLSLPVRWVNQRRDPHNFIATVKPIVDGMVDAGVWPDDSARYLAVAEPEFHQAGREWLFSATLTRLP